MARKRKSNKFGTDQKSSLFVGRWQPFHAGHKKLIETVLKKGKPVTIAIRDTEISHSNPYSVYERWTMIQRALRKYGELVKIVVIPDINEICYGRDVGYLIRRIDLDHKTESLSGTKTREKNSPTLPIYWLTGQSGSGKTSIAEALHKKIGAVILDGDEMRKSISLGAGFTKEDREEHNLRVARLAKVMAKRSSVVVSVIAPFRSTRKKIDEIAKPVWIYVKRNLKESKNKPYEVPSHPDIVVDSDKQRTREQVETILRWIRRHSK
jgi:cytidyltransferase-like protein